MSGIYIKGMEMPTRCCDCKMYVEDIYYCPLLAKEIENPWADDGVELGCPLVPVPEHGRLGDLDELFKRMFVGPDGQRYPDKDVDGWNHTYTFRLIKHEILSAPTIIPADKEGE